MIEKLLQDNEFVELMQQHCYEIIQTLIKKNIEFSIVCNTKYTQFNPELPKHLDLSENPYTLFALAGYTFTSIKLDKEYIHFHAGFETDDFATFVRVDLGAITQIQIENNVIFINFSFYKRKDENLAKKSIDLFLNNPKNKDIFKK